MQKETQTSLSLSDRSPRNRSHIKADADEQQQEPQDFYCFGGCLFLTDSLKAISYFLLFFSFIIFLFSNFLLPVLS